MKLERRLGGSDLRVSAMGLGCWAAGGSLWYMDGDTRYPLCWGEVDDEESIRAIQRAMDLGINYFDTADSYGAGHSEEVLGKAVEGRRGEVVISTKFGDLFESDTRTWLGHDHPNGRVTREYVRKACDASLKRLSTDYIDIYFFHWKEYDSSYAIELVPVLEELVDENKIRYYGWSTPYIEQAQVFTEGRHCIAMQYNYNIFERNPEMLDLCSKHGLTTVARGPLAMGILTGKYTKNSKIPENDVRSRWNLKEGRIAQQLEMLDAIREVLTEDGRTLPQAALGWLWALDPQVVPISGFKTVKQVEDNFKAIRYGPLSPRQMRDIDEILREFPYNLIELD
jgi:aryl-alcohol dehydrogenase-like predicted oxidoreductase